MLHVNHRVSIPEKEVLMWAIRAQGAGGQNVNKVSTAIHLHFEVMKSSLPESYKQALLNMHDSRISRDGVITIKAQRFRSLERNREDALKRLVELLRSAGVVKKTRIPTKATKAAQRRRLNEKKQRGQTKSLRRKISGSDT